MRELARISRENQYQPSANSTIDEATGSRIKTKRRRHLRIRMTAIHVERAEFPLSRLLFELTLALAVNDANKHLEKQQQAGGGSGGTTANSELRKLRLELSVRSANTCSHQIAGALAAEEYYMRRARLFVVSGCDEAIRGVSRLASQWRVPIMTAAGFGADLADKSVHRTLVRVAFSLRAAVEFLFKILRMFQWRRVNLVVDESHPNSLALKDSVEKHLASHRSSAGANFSVDLNTIVLDLDGLFAFQTGNTSARAEQKHLQPSDDKWPNEITEQAIGDTLWRCARFSRVTVVLMGQRHLRKFMLSAYDRSMANGQYTFINIPLLRTDPEDAEMGANTSGVANGGGGTAGASATSSSAMTHSSPAGPAAATGEEEFLWRSPQPKARNAHTRKAFESLMSIHLRIPTTKAYLYFANNLNTLANSMDHVAPLAGRTTMATSAADRRVPPPSGKRIKLNTNPYSASFYDSVQIYARALHESLELMAAGNDTTTPLGERLRQTHAMVSELMRDRRFDNMVTGSVAINRLGDRETDFTLDDMIPMTGLFAPVILYSGDTRDTQRIARIHWSSDASGESLAARNRALHLRIHSCTTEASHDQCL